MAFVTRLVAAAAGTRVAAATGKYGVWGAAAGLIVTSAILRWPGKALLVGAALGARNLYSKSVAPTPLLEDRSATGSAPTSQLSAQ